MYQEIAGITTYEIKICKGPRINNFLDLTKNYMNGSENGVLLTYRKFDNLEDW